MQVKKAIMAIHLKIIYRKYYKRIYILGIPYSLVSTTLQFCYSSDETKNISRYELWMHKFGAKSRIKKTTTKDHWKFEIRNSAKFGFSPNFGKWHSVSEFEEQNSAVCSNIRPFDPRTRTHLSFYLVTIVD